MGGAPLAGLRVVELAGVLAGPSAGQFLAELGADVVKVENLRTRGKTIGVISHVDAMKDRIRTQIVVRKLTAGRSTVEVVSIRDS